MKIIFFTLFNLIFGISSALAHGISDPDKMYMVQGGLKAYFKLGAKHMLTGYDHLLFLFAVIFFITRFRDVVKFITAFTLGHSITLLGATYFEITKNYYLVDAVIALSICYKGFDNIDGFKKYFKINPPNILFMIFLFGLVHGFGLSTRLQQLPLGDHNLIAKILSFNVGVEVGQILALAPMIFFLKQWRKTESFKKFSLASNYALILAGLGLFIFQMSGYMEQKRQFFREHPQGWAASISPHIN